MQAVMCCVFAHVSVVKGMLVEGMPLLWITMLATDLHVEGTLLVHAILFAPFQTLMLC